MLLKCSANAITAKFAIACRRKTHSTVIKKSCCWNHKSINFLYFFVLSSTTVRNVNQFLLYVGDQLEDNQQTLFEFDTKACKWFLSFKIKHSESCWRLPSGPKSYTTNGCNLQYSLFQWQSWISFFIKNWSLLTWQYRNVLLNHQ